MTRIVRWTPTWREVWEGSIEWWLDETIEDGECYIDAYEDHDAPQRKQLLVERIGEDGPRGDDERAEFVRAQFWSCICEPAEPFGGDGCGWQVCGNSGDGSIEYYRSEVVDGKRLAMQGCTELEWREGRVPGTRLRTWSRTVTLWRGTDWAGRPRGE